MTTKRRRKPKLSPTWSIGDRCLVDFDGEPYAGELTELEGEEAQVTFDDGDKLDFNISDLQPEVPDDDQPKHTDAGQGGGRGFNTYPVAWNQTKTSFRVLANSHQFYGCWRRTTYEDVDTHEKVPGYSVDLWCSFKNIEDGKTRDYAVRTIFYQQAASDDDEEGAVMLGDPRANMRSLNGDICAAINEFLFRKLSGDLGTLEELRKKSEQPMFHVDSIETLDRFILKLREYRDMAIRSGGRRVLAVPTDRGKEDPRGALVIDVTAQAILLEGKVPSLEMGAVIDSVAKTGSKKRTKTAAAVVNKPNDEHVLELCQQLESATDKAEQRRLRGMLRRMGHKGGMRALRKKLAQQD